MKVDFLVALDSEATNRNEVDRGLIPGLVHPWRREWLSLPGFLPGEFYGQSEPGEGTIQGVPKN